MISIFILLYQLLMLLSTVDVSSSANKDWALWPYPIQN